MNKLLLCSAILLALVPLSSVGRHVQKPPILIQAETLKRILGPATVPLQPLAEANANEWVDQFLANLGPFLIRNNLDPFPIMDIDEEFGFWFVKARLYLRNGLLWDVSTVKRKGNATLGYEHKLLDVAFDVEFPDLMADFDYRATFIGLGPSGILKAKITNLEVKMEILIDLELQHIYLQDFQLASNGRVKIDITGLGFLVDTMAEAVINAITLLFDDTIVGIIAGQMRRAIENAFDSINNRGY